MLLLTSVSAEAALPRGRACEAGAYFARATLSLMKLPCRLPVVVVALCMLLCPAFASGVLFQTQTPRELHYTVDFSQEGRVHVRLTYRMPTTSATEEILLPSHWAGALHLERAITQLHAASTGAMLNPTSRPARFMLRSRPGESVTLEYDLLPDWTGPFRFPERHRVLLRPGLFSFSGENALVAPKLLPDAVVHVTFDFTGLPSGQALVTSFGTAAHQERAGAWAEIQSAFFSGGKLRTREFPVQGSPVLLAIFGDWGFTDQELTLKVHQLLAAERSFWRDAQIPWYAVVVLPFERASSGGGGTAFTNAFALTLAPSQSFDTEIESLLAHEAFHEWNPNGLGRLADGAALGWFVEGFTTYYQDVMLERSGMLEPDEYLQRLNHVLRDYQILPKGHADSIKSQRSADPEVDPSLDQGERGDREVYVRGAAIAAWLSGEITEQTAGRRTLDDFMRALRAERSEPLTEDRLFATLGRFVSKQTVVALRRYAAGKAEVPITASGFGPCASVVTQSAWTFALGLPRRELHDGAVLEAVDPQGPAFRAGLRAGQTVRGWTVWDDDPDREAVLSMMMPDGSLRQVRYFPRGSQVAVSQIEVRSDCALPKPAK